MNVLPRLSSDARTCLWCHTEWIYFINGPSNTIDIVFSLDQADKQLGFHKMCLHFAVYNIMN